MKKRSSRPTAGLKRQQDEIKEQQAHSRIKKAAGLRKAVFWPFLDVVII
jgi:hypothetical protein